MDICYQKIYAMNKEEAKRLIVQAYLDTGNLSLTAKLCHTSHHVVHKWVRRYHEESPPGLEDHPRTPKVSPHKIPSDMEEKVIAAGKRTGYGRERLAWYLAREEGINLSPHTLRHIW
jgi:transposase-like protein